MSGEDKPCSKCHSYRYDDRRGFHVCINPESIRHGRVVDKNYSCSRWDGEIDTWDGPPELKWVKEYVNDTILKHSDLVVRLSKERVLIILYNKDKHRYYIQEQCDEYFDYELTRGECLELSYMFREMAADMEDEPETKNTCDVCIHHDACEMWTTGTLESDGCLNYEKVE